MDSDIPHSIREDLRGEIRKKLWQANVLYRNGTSLTECLEIAYDAYAKPLERAGLLTSEIVHNEIPAWVLDWVVIFRWRAPRLYPSAPRRNDAQREGVPRPTLGWSVPQRGDYLSLIFPAAQWTLELIQAVIVARIAYWRTWLPQIDPAPLGIIAERKRRRTAVVESLLVERGWSENEWAQEADVDHHTVADYLNGETKKLYASTRKKLAQSLGLKAEDLPD
jgi:hypothetical protein